MKAFLALMAALLVMSCAHAEVRDTVNWARQHGCRSAPARTGLRDNPRLDAAALLMANGQALHASLVASGYLAAQSSAVHVSGVVDDSDVGRMLVAHDCGSLTDAAFSEVGVLRRGRDVWMVLAAPVALPAARDAAVVSRQILGLVNAARAVGRRCGSKTFGPAGPLALNQALTAAALAHSEDMARSREFEHRGHDGSSPAARVARAGYGDVLVVGENIAAGAMTPAEVTDGWLSSPAHCENIMDPRFVEIGIAFAVNVASEELVYWTQDFAGRRK